MKILQLIPNISGGGAERLVVDLSNQLVKDHDITLLTLYNPREDDLFRDQLSPQIETISLGKKVGFDFKILFKLYRAVKSISPDVIHNHLRSFNYLMLCIPFLDDISIIHTVHNDAYKECPNSKTRFLRKLFFKRRNIQPVTISEESANSFENAYQDIDHSLIYNGRRYPKKGERFDRITDEIESFKKDQDTRVFVNIGRIIPQKNQLMLVKAFNRLVNKDNANSVLLMIGGGRNNQASKEIQWKLKEAEKKHDHIYILGERSNATDYLHAADFFCLSSIYEGMPITLIEAFATGTIPVCTPVGGIPEMVSKLDSSLLSKSTDEEDYYEVLKRAYCLEEEKQSKLKKRAADFFDELYSMEHCADKYEKLFKKLGS